MLLLSLLLLASAPDTIAAPAVPVLPSSVAPGPSVPANPSPDRGYLPASVAETDLIWTASGCDYVPAAKIKQCLAMVRQGKPYHPSMRVPLERAAFGPVPRAPRWRMIPGHGRVAVSLNGHFGYGGEFVVSGATATAGGLWEYLQIQVGGGFTESRQTVIVQRRSNPLQDSVEETKIRSDKLLEAEVLIGDFSRPTPVAGIGGRIGNQRAGFVSLGYSIPNESGAITGVVRLGAQVAMANLSITYNPWLQRKRARRTSPQGY